MLIGCKVGPQIIIGFCGQEWRGRRDAVGEMSVKVREGDRLILSASSRLFVNRTLERLDSRNCSKPSCRFRGEVPLGSLLTWIASPNGGIPLLLDQGQKNIIFVKVVLEVVFKNLPGEKTEFRK